MSRDIGKAVTSRHCRCRGDDLIAEKVAEGAERLLQPYRQQQRRTTFGLEDQLTYVQGQLHLPTSTLPLPPPSTASPFLPPEQLPSAEQAPPSAAQTSALLSGAGEPARGHGTEGLHTAISAPKPTASSDSLTRAPLELLPAANSSPLPAATKPPETRVLGLHGMGGIGKSVLARTLYDNAVGRKVLSKSFSVSGSKLASFVPCVCL